MKRRLWRSWLVSHRVSDGCLWPWHRARPRHRRHIARALLVVRYRVGEHLLVGISQFAARLIVQMRPVGPDADLRNIGQPLHGGTWDVEPPDHLAAIRPRARQSLLNEEIDNVLLAVEGLLF
jgi:hypothetical protein